MDEHHPDLVSIDRLVAERFDRVIRAEQEAAAVTRRRTATLRDRLIDCEEAERAVRLALPSGTATGDVVTVGLDHVELQSAAGRVIVPLSAIESIATA